MQTLTKPGLMISDAPEPKKLAQLHQQLAELSAKNAQLEAQLQALQQDQLQALAVQNRLLPAQNTKILGWQLNYHLEAALHLSGDFLDFFSPVGANLEAKLYFYLADVAGSGSASALISLLVKYLLKKLTLTHPSFSPAQLCRALNQELLNLNLEKHLTLALGCFTPSNKQLSFCLAAQLPQPIIVTANRLEVIQSQSAPLGLFPTAEFTDYTCTLETPSTLCLASDGVLEVMQGEGLNAKHLAWQNLVAQHQGDLNQLVAALTKPATGWQDDLTIMTLSNR